MFQFSVGLTYDGTLRALFDSIKELKGRLEFFRPDKGIVVFTKPWYTWYSLLTMVVEIEPSDEGCTVSLTAFPAGIPFRPHWTSRRYERAFAKRLKANLS